MTTYPNYLPDMTTWGAEKQFGVPDSTTSKWLKDKLVSSTLEPRGSKTMSLRFCRLEYFRFLLSPAAGNHQLQPADIPICDITLDEKFQLRTGLNPQTVDEYAEKIALGKTLLPVLLARVGGKLFLVAGHHRVAATEKTGGTVIKAHILENCSEEEAFFIALTSNIEFGLRPTPRDRKRAATEAILRPENRDMTDVDLAKLLDYSREQINRMRGKLLSGESAKPRKPRAATTDQLFRRKIRQLLQSYKKVNRSAATELLEVFERQKVSMAKSQV